MIYEEPGAKQSYWEDFEFRSKLTNISGYKNCGAPDAGWDVFISQGDTPRCSGPPVHHWRTVFKNNRIHASSLYSLHPGTVADPG